MGPRRKTGCCRDAEADHRKVADLFAKFEAATGDGKKKALASRSA